MKRLIELLHSEGCSCVIESQGEIRAFRQRGVADLYDLYQNERDFMQNAQLADKVIGKGAAALIVLGKMKEVYADIISTPALSLLRAAGIKTSFGKEVPFIIKGIMTVKGALKAKEAGAAAIVVSNHGGRVLDQCPATAEVLAEIADAVGNDMKILVDGGIRSGVDIFKALALGADAVLIGRPFVTAVYGGGAEGVAAYTAKLAAELEDTMAMCGAHSLSEISRDMVR